MDLSLMMSFDCCEDKTEQMQSTDVEEEEKDDCCNFLDCHCLCCVHTMLNTHVTTFDIPLVKEVFSVTYNYTNNYKLLYQNLVWHPPKHV